MIKDDINEAKHLLRKQCRFYANEVEAPRFEQPNGALLWDYERRWVEWTVESDSYLNEVFVNYLRAGLSDFEAADGTPISLKALLYDRYVHWSSFGEDVEENFRKWYREEYQSRPRMIEKDARDLEEREDNSFGFKKEIVEEYHRVEDEQMYYSMGGNTGCLGGRTTPDYISELRENEIFVFGSNKRGAHGAGAAAFAVRKFGAKMGQGDGLQGQSYAISTMEGLLETARNVKRFLRFAEEHQELRFYVTPIACGIAGYTPLQIAPLFEKALVLPNVFLPRSFWEYIWMTEGTGPDFFRPSDEWKKWDKKYNMPRIEYTTVKPRKCSKCGGNVYRILYGEPVCCEEEYFERFGEHVVLGGCCITGDDPEWACSECGETFVQDIEGLCIDEIDEKLSLYQRILELEDLLEIKHKPQILKEVWDTMNDYSCELKRIFDEIAYSELEEANKESSNVDDEKKHQIEESYKELEARNESLINQYNVMMEFDRNSEFIQQVEDDILYEKLPLLNKIQEREDYIGIAHRTDVLELSEDEMWKYYHELLDMPIKSDKLSQEGRIVAVERRQPLIDYSGDDLSLDPNMW